MRIAVVRNQARGGVINQFGSPSPERYGKRTVEHVVRALEACGHEVTLLEGDKTLLAQLEDFAPPDPDTGYLTGIVLNMAYGIQGEARYTHVPAMLELAGVPYTGASPLGHAVSLDKPTTKRLLQSLAIPTPAFALMDRPGPLPAGLRYPLIVKPRHESTSYGLALVHNQAELEQAVAAIVAQYRQAALVEQYVDGREVCVSLLGNDPPAVLPVVELSFDQQRAHLMTWADKYHRRADEPTKLCPAPLPSALLRRVENVARRTFACCHARDYARVDIRIDRHGDPWVLELNSMASLGPRGSYTRAAEAAGFSFERLVNRIVEVACDRYGSVPAAKPDPTPARGHPSTKPEPRARDHAPAYVTIRSVATPARNPAASRYSPRVRYP